MDQSFIPPLFLRNGHIQTTLASSQARKMLSRTRAKELLANSREQVLDCGDEIRLLGAYSAQKKPEKGLVTLIHGWEGSIDSTYILSAGATLFRQGYDVFRLNLRDHGDSHHLNRELFNSTRLDEAVNAISEIHRLFPHDRNFLAGFSLGGNFALRIGVQARQSNINLTAIATVSPLINPVEATRNLEENHPFYHHYFVRKWQKSLKKKLALFPDLNYGDSLLKLSSLTAMHDYFVPRHTEYATTTSYLSAYRITGDQFTHPIIPTCIIAADDDPITRKADLDQLGRPAGLTINRVRHGGHCGFLEDVFLNSWADHQLVQIFEQTKNGRKVSTLTDIP